MKPLPETASQDVEIWDVEKGDLIARAAGQSASVEDLAFHPGGELLATSHEDGTVRLWDARTGAQRLLLEGSPALVTDIDFSPDGAHLATYGGEGVVRVWALGLDEITSLARARLTRTFTDEECRLYFHTEDCTDRSSTR